MIAMIWIITEENEVKGKNGKTYFIYTIKSEKSYGKLLSKKKISYKEWRLYIVRVIPKASGKFVNFTYANSIIWVDKKIDEIGDSVGSFLIPWKLF